MVQETRDTRSAVLAAACTLLDEVPFDDISYRVLGDTVGVAERTVFRHFPTRAHLLTGVAQRIDTLEMPFAPFRTAAEFRASTRQRFLAFDTAPRKAGVLARSAAVSPVSAPEPDFLTHAVVAVVEHELPGANRRDLRRAAGALRTFAAPLFWAHARTSLGMDGAAAADVLDVVTERVLAALRPAGEHAQSSSSSSSSSSSLPSWPLP
ncbi:transcriptional regulator, TetR family [Quadrisphaera granulorum]|uniref:TetR family transcriptional regulator n=1 Tax=Quadrisphaera granulorum TaxID=317664 RepID=A0A315ZQJ5_9ACTN|nr:TetR/AcrR family transcriptional regulator [Quadrisphaera granulorum]PWJ47373.1 TetR family transcriptional regulator [Quadrisphaera granulorum]SZE98820.1 transcriptional regulator, TetR family [Quadrisphaera granulorum]